MKITESEIRKLIRKTLLESTTNTTNGNANNVISVKIENNFINNFKNLGIYKDNVIKDFVDIIETKGITSFFNDILIILNGGNASIEDSDANKKIIIDNIKTLDGTTKPWTATSADSLVDKLNKIDAAQKTDNKSIINRLYNMTAPSQGASAWGAGKGEILSLLLTDKRYKTGGSGKKDLYNSDVDFIELKQIDKKATKININISSLKPGEQIAKDFAENLKDLKGSINVFQNILQEDFIDTNELKNKNWVNLFFDSKNKVKTIKNKPDSINPFFEEFEEGQTIINIEDEIETNMYDLFARFIFKNYNNNNKAEYEEYIKYSFFDPTTSKQSNEAINNLKISSNIKTGKIFPIFGKNNTIASYTNDITECYNNKKQYLVPLFKKTPKNVHTTDYTKLDNAIKSFTSASNLEKNPDWYINIDNAFNNYFNNKLDIINEPDKLNLDLNRFSLGDFDTLMNDILLGSVTKIKDKITGTNSDLTSHISTDDISVTLDDGKNEIELYTKIDDIEILEPNPIPNLSNIDQIPDTIKKINIKGLSFNDEKLKKKLKDKKYKRFFSLNENILYESNAIIPLQSSLQKDNLNDTLTSKQYINIDKYKKTKDLKNATLLQKINNLIANLICLEKSISKYFGPGLIVVSEEKVKEDNSKFTNALVMCSSKINQIDDNIKNGNGNISFFDLNKMKVETKTPAENLLFKLIQTRNSILSGIKDINAITIP